MNLIELEKNKIGVNSSSFAKKVQSFADITDDLLSPSEPVECSHLAIFDANEYVQLQSDLLGTYEWMYDLGGWNDEGCRRAVLCVNSGNGEMFLVDPSGYTYARYVGFIRPLSIVYA